MKLANIQTKYLDNQEFTIVVTRRELSLMYMAASATAPADFNRMLNCLGKKHVSDYLESKETSHDEISPLCDEIEEILVL